MCSVKTWEFNCPQFVDFEAGLESSVTEVWLEDENEHRKTLATLSQPFTSRMATPKIIKLENHLKTSPFVKVSRAVKTDDEKIALSKMPRRRSKSNPCFNRPVESWVSPEVRKQPNRAAKLNRKKSLSENNLKRRVVPATPMCLKRTLKKPTYKRKTTEEIEMDKIAELQNKLYQQLRLNEVNLQRMKSNKAPYPAQKVLKEKFKTQGRTRIVKGEDQPNQPNDLISRKMKSRNDDFIKAQNSKENRSEALRAKSKRLQTVLDSVFKNSAAASSVLRVVNGNNKKQYRKKYGEYCGLDFYPNQDKKTVPQPFSFDSSSVSQNASFCLKEIKADSSAFKTATPFSGKENIFKSIPIRKEKQKK